MPPIYLERASLFLLHASLLNELIAAIFKIVEQRFKGAYVLSNKRFCETFFEHHSITVVATSLTICCLIFRNLISRAHAAEAALRAVKKEKEEAELAKRGAETSFAASLADGALVNAQRKVTDVERQRSSAALVATQEEGRVSASGIVAGRADPHDALDKISELEAENAALRNHAEFLTTANKEACETIEILKGLLAPQ